MLEHVRLAKDLQVPEAIAPDNGDIIRLAPGPAQMIDEVPSGRLYVDGSVIVEAEDEALRDRKRLATEGAINVSLAVNGKHAIVAGPNVSAARPRHGGRGRSRPGDG